MFSVRVLQPSKSSGVREGEQNFNIRLLFSAVPLEVIIMDKLLVNYITGLLYRVVRGPRLKSHIGNDRFIEPNCWLT